MAISPFVVLLLESAGMLVGTYFCGIVPLYLSLSKTKLRILEVMGAGLLVGASMTVVLPEGVSALFTPQGEPHAHMHALSERQYGVDGPPSSTAAAASLVTAGVQHAPAWAWSMLARRDVAAVLEEGGTHRHGHGRSFDPESATGMAILSGFLLMFLIDQVAAPGAHTHAPSSALDREAGASGYQANRQAALPPSQRPETLRLMRASSLNYPAAASAPGGTTGISSPRLPHQHENSASSNGSAESMPADHDDVGNAGAPLLHARTASPTTRNDVDESSTRSRKPSDAASGRDGGAIGQSRNLRGAIASVAGLMIHAAADGIAMGASAGTGDDSLKLIVLFAIMIHKAPAAFGLCTLLMGRRLHKTDIRRAIAFFSLATPVGAIISYLFLSLVLSSSPESGEGIQPHHIGGALTFSAGTFMYVAMHAVNELAAAAADIDSDAVAAANGAHRHHHHHHPPHHGGTASDADSVRAAQSPSAPSGQPRQILGRTGRIAVFVLGSMLPKTLQSLVGHGH